MKIAFSGGAHEIGASCMLLRVDGKNILLDSGIRQDSTKDRMPDFSIIQQLGGVDAIIVSHAHLDHCGSLPIISNEYPFARIYMNYMTKDLVRVLLYDSLKVMNNREGEVPRFAEVHVKNMLDRVFVINPEVEFEIFDGIRVTLYAAGHIAGACSVYIKAAEGALFYSGDFSLFAQNTVEGARIPKLRPDAAIFESTYGDKLHSNREVEEGRLMSLSSECLNRGGKVLIPSFALGRAQEVILILRKALNNGKIKNVKIYIDGMVKDINTVYKLHPTYLRNSLAKRILKGIDPFYNDNICIIASQEERDGIISSNEPCIIVSSSGMLNGGPSQYYAEKLCSCEENLILLTGYQDEESPGRKLLSLLDEEIPDRVLEINGRKMPVRCSIEKVGLSAHGDKSEIKASIQSMSPKNIFLVHGDGSILEGFGKELAKEVWVPVYIPGNGDIIDIEIKNPRKQLQKKFDSRMNRNDSLCEISIGVLWEFVLNNYGSRLFTCEDLLSIWSGDNEFSSQLIAEASTLLLNSVYFETDSRRLFLYRAKERDIVEEELRPKELKQNEVNDLVKDFFEEFGYQKAGLFPDERKVILYFDFPRSIDESIYDKMKLFTDKTGWEVSIYGQSNINAAERLIRQLLSDISIKKISYYSLEYKFKVTVRDNFKAEDEIDRFRKITGLDIDILKDDPINRKNQPFIYSSGDNSTSRMEQNATLKYIDDYFENKDHKPYKKSIKINETVPYIELSFISPILGNRYADDFKTISSNTGWDIVLSSSVNQNEIINLAVSLCRSLDIEINKNPSFNPSDISITVKVKKEEVIRLNEKKDDFLDKTGCILIVKEM